MNIHPPELEHLASTFTFQFTNSRPKQSLIIEEHLPMYFGNDSSSESDELPGDGCGKNMLASYPTIHAPYEPYVTAFLIWLSQQTSELRMIDVGALWGHTSLVAASMFKQSTIHLFEMNPLTATVLKANLDLNGHLNATFKLHNVLLSDVDSETMVTFRHYTARYGIGDGSTKPLSPLKVWHENLKSQLKRLTNRHSRGMFRKVRMKVARLDSMFQDQSFKPNLIKIDVEGSQYNIVEGSRELIQRHRPFLLIEFDQPGAANEIGRTNRDLLKLLCSWGYSCLWGDHRARQSKWVTIQPDSPLDIEVNSLGIFLPT